MAGRGDVYIGKKFGGQLTTNDTVTFNFGKGYPTNMVLDHTGTIQHFMVGGLTNPDELQEFFKLIYSPKIRELIRKLKKRK